MSAYNILNIFYDFPQGAEIVPEFSDKTGKDSSGSRYVYSVINVTDARAFEDGGEYVCTVRNHMGQENNATVDITITGGCTGGEIFLTTITVAMAFESTPSSMTPAALTICTHSSSTFFLPQLTMLQQTNIDEDPCRLSHVKHHHHQDEGGGQGEAADDGGGEDKCMPMQVKTRLNFNFAP